MKPEWGKGGERKELGTAVLGGSTRQGSCGNGVGKEIGVSCSKHRLVPSDKRVLNLQRYTEAVRLMMMQQDGCRKKEQTPV